MDKKELQDKIEDQLILVVDNEIGVKLALENIMKLIEKSDLQPKEQR